MNTKQERDINMAPGFSRRILSDQEAMATGSALAFINVDPSKQEEITLEFTLSQVSDIAKSLRKGENGFDLAALAAKNDKGQNLSREEFASLVEIFGIDPKGYLDFDLVKELEKIIQKYGDIAIKEAINTI